MHITINSALLNQENEIALMTLAKKSHDKRIFIEFSDITAAEKWIKSLANPHQQYWDNILRQYIVSAKVNIKKGYLPQTKITIIPEEDTESLSPPIKMRLRTAEAIFSQSIKIGLKNTRNDFAFLLSVLPKKFREALKSLYDNGQVEVFGGGIGELKKLIEAKSQNQNFKIISWVLFDSDSTYPGHVQQSTTDIIQVCQENNISYHCLERRMIENYISQEIYLEAHENRHNQQSENIYKLNEEQRKYFNFKIGFKNTTEHTHALYSGIDAGVIKNLRTGLGDKLASRVYDNDDNHEKIYQKLSSSGILGEFGDKLKHLEQLIGRPV